MALDGAFRDEQACRDLGVAQMLLHRPEYLELAGGYAVVNRCGRIRHPSIIALASRECATSQDYGVSAVLMHKLPF